MISPYASGLMDSYFTAADLNKQMHGIEIHANILQMFLEDNYKAYVPAWLNLLILIFIMAGLSLLFMRLDVRVLFAVLVLFAVGFVLLNRFIFGKDYIITLVYPVITAVVLYTFTVVYNYITERLEKQKIKDMFKKYVDPKLVDVLIDTNVTGIGQKKHFAVLFVDIRGFTPMSEKLRDEPETVVYILNEYLEFTASCVFNNGGTVNTAARLESNAKASQVLISRDVFDSLKGRITAESLGEIEMKGKGPIDVAGMSAAEVIEIAETRPFMLKEGIQVTPFRSVHHNETIAFRIDSDKSVVYLLDYEIRANFDRYDELVKFCKNADLVIFDATYLPEDYPPKRGWGHSTFDDGFALAEAASCKKMVFSHLCQDYSDTVLDEASKGLDSRRFLLAYDGLELEI